MLLLFALRGWAEQFLTYEEAAKVCFPQADTFEEQTILFSKAEKEAIQKRLGQSFPHRGHRVRLAYRDEAFLGTVVFDRVLGKHELIDYAVAISPGGKVAAVEILEYRESHGGEIRSEKWLAQFEEKNADDSIRLNEDIYNISGATISCRNVTEGVRRILDSYEVVLRARIAAEQRLPDNAFAGD